MEGQRFSPIQIARFGLLLLAVTLLGLAAWFIFTHGGVQIKTASAQSTISITPVDEQKNTVSKKTGKDLFAILKNGQYIVNIQDGNKQTRTTITVKRFAITTKELSPPEILQSEAVSNISSASFAASSSTLSVLDDSAGELVLINQANSYTHTDSTIRYEAVVWKKSGEGYGVGTDLNSNTRTLAHITGGVAQTVTPPEPITTDTYLAFGYSQAGELYILQQGNVYKQTASGYEKVGNTNKQSLILSVNSVYATFLYRNGEDQCEVQFMSLSDKNIQKRPVECLQDPAYTYSAEWSSDSKRLALTTGDSLTILDPSLNTLKTIPDYRAAHPVWLTATKVAYTSGNNIWTYDTDTDTTSVIASTPSYVTVQALRKADDSDTLYYSGLADDTSTLYRTHTLGDDLTDLDKLSESNMQTLSAGCRIRYVNFTKPSLVIMSASATKDDCLNQAKDYLASISVSLSEYQYDVREDLGATDYLDNLHD